MSEEADRSGTVLAIFCLGMSGLAALEDDHAVRCGEWTWGLVCHTTISELSAEWTLKFRFRLRKKKLRSSTAGPPDGRKGQST